MRREVLAPLGMTTPQAFYAETVLITVTSLGDRQAFAKPDDQSYRSREMGTDEESFGIVNV